MSSFQTVKDLHNSSIEHRPEWLDEGLYPFTSHYIDLGGSRVHFIDEGSGPTLLFLHPDPAWSFIYRNIIKGLRDRFRCVALDFPGFGLSKAARDFRYSPPENSRIVEEFIQRLDLSELTLMVHSQSGPISLGAAGRNPERFKALVVCNTFAWPLDDYKKVKYMLGFMGTHLAGFLFMNFNVMLKFMQSDRADRVLRPWTQAEKAAYYGPFRERSSRRSMHLMMRGLARRDFLSGVERGLAHLQALPVLNLWSDGDHRQIPAWSERFEQLFPNHQTVIIPGAKHFLQEDNPEGVIASIRDWWEDEVRLEPSAAFK